MNTPSTIPLPISLLNRLSSDETLSLQSLISDPLPQATQTVRSTTDRRLLHLTGKALDTLDNLLEVQDPKVRLGAASKLLDTSPITKPQPFQTQESTIPLSAIKPLFEGIASLFSRPQSESPYPTYTIVQPEPPNPNPLQPVIPHTTKEPL